MNYEEKCLELDKGLAKLIGFTDVKDSVLYPSRIAGKLNGEHQTIARWTQDDAAAFRLAVEHELDVEIGENFVKAAFWVNGFAGFSDVDFPDCPSKFSAVRYAIVQAVINKLRAANG